MDANLIGWIVTGFIILILLYSAMVGAIRGFKVALFRFIWLSVTALILVFVTPLITNALNNIDISSLNININGQVSKLSDIGTNLLNSITGIDEAILNSESINELATNLPAMILNIPFFILLFFITKWLLWPIYAIICNATVKKKERKFKKAKKEQKKLEKKYGEIKDENEKQNKFKKYRFGGLVVGLVTGLLFCLVIFMPIAGVNNIYQQLLAVKVDDGKGQEVSLVENLFNVDEGTLKYLSLYQNSVAGNILTYTGVDYLGTKMFNKFTTCNVGDDKVNLSDETSNAIQAFNSVKKISNLTSKTLTQPNLNSILVEAKNILAYISKSKIVVVIGNDVLPKMANNYIIDPNFKPFNDEFFDSLFKESLDDYLKNSTFNVSSIKDQITGVVDIAIYLNNSNVIVPLINNDNSDINSILSNFTNNIPDDFVNNLVNKLYDVEMFNKVYGKLANKGIELLYSELNLSFSEQSIDGATLKNSLKTVLQSAFEVGKNYFDNTNLDFGNQSKYVLENLGNIIDTLKTSLLNQANYNTLLDYGISKINDLTSEFADLSSVTSSFKEIDNFKNELGSLSNLYNSVVKLVNDKVTIDKIKQEDYKLFTNVGASLDTIINATDYKSKIITNKNIKGIFKAVLDKVEIPETINEILKINFSESLTVKDKILENIYSDSTGASSISWQNEFEMIRKLLSFDSSDSSLISLGKLLDQTNNSNLLDKDVKTVIIKDNLDKIKVDESLQASINDIKENVSDIESFEREFTYIQNLIDAIDKTYDTNEQKFIALGKTFDTITTGDNKSVLLTQKIIKDIIKSTFDKFMTNDFESTDIELKNIIKQISANITGTTEDVSFETELSFIADLTNIVDAKDKLSIGKTFDEIRGDSKFISSDILNELVMHYYNKEKANITLSNSDYNKIITLIGKNIESLKTDTSKTYTKLFEEIFGSDSSESLITLLNSFSSVEGKSDVSEISQETFLKLGKNIDKLQDVYTISCGKEVAYEVADIVLTNVLESICLINSANNGDPEYEAKKALRNNVNNNVINGEEFKFNLYNTENFDGTYSGTTYYESLMQAIYDAVQPQPQE